MPTQQYLVCLSLSVVSAPRSLPARSMKDSFPTSRASFESEPSADLLMASWSIACDREDSSFAPVVPVLLVAFPFSINSLIVSTFDTLYSCKPTMHTCCFPSSLMQSFLQNENTRQEYKHDCVSLLFLYFIKSPQAEVTYFLSFRRSNTFPPYISKKLTYNWNPWLRCIWCINLRISWDAFKGNGCIV